VTRDTAGDRSVTGPDAGGWHDPAVTGLPAATGGTSPRRSRLSELTDEELVQRAQSGNSRAFETLLRRHERAMFGTSLRLLGRPSDAEDAVQEAFIAAWRRLPEFRGDARFSTWLYRIVTRRALNKVTRGRAAELADLLDEVADLVPGPAAQAERNLAVDAVTDALAALPFPQRAVVILHHFEGLSYAQVAEVTRSSVPAVRSHLFRARRTLGTKLEEWR